MRYAVIALIATYLLTFACSPEKPEHEAGKAENAPHSAIVESGQNQHPTEATEQEQHQGVAPDLTDQSQAQEQPAGNQWEAIAKSAGNTVMALMNKQEGATQPEEKAAVPVAESAAPQPNDAQPAAAQEVPAPQAEQEHAPQVATSEAAATEQPETTEEVVKTQTIVMPCGRVVEIRQGEELPPCAQEYVQEQEENQAETQPVPPAEAAPQPQQDELGLAMENMVNATNNMVAVAEQLLNATQQIVVASKGVASEMVDNTREILKEQKDAVENTGKEELLSSLQKMVDAAKNVLDATSQAISSARQDVPADQQ